MTQIPFKAVAVDLDGTFLTEKKYKKQQIISVEAKKHLTKSKGPS